MTSRGATALSIVGLVALSLDAGLVAISIVLVIAASCVPAATWARRCVYAGVCLFAANSTLFTVLALTGVRCNPDLVTGIALVVLAVATALLQPRPRVPLSDKDDLVALLLAGVTIAVLLPPLIHASPGAAMALLSQTTDGGNHTQLVLGTQRVGGYLAFRPVEGMQVGGETYPGAWSANVWFLGRVVIGHVLSPVEAVRLLGYVSLAAYGLLTFLVARLSLTLLAQLGVASAARRVQATLSVALTMTFGLGLFLLNLNSYTQIASLVGILTSLLVLGENASARQQLLLLTASTMVVGQTWYLLLPLTLAIAAVAFAHNVPAGRELVLAALVATPVLAFPLLTGPGAGQVRFPGSQLLPTLMGILGLLLSIGLSVLALLRGRPSVDSIRLGSASVLVASLLLLVGLIVVQPHDEPGLSYYAAKTLIALMVVGTAAAAGYGATAGRRQAIPALAVVGLVLGTWSTRHIALPPRIAHTDGYVRADVLDAMYDRHRDSLDAATDVWVLDDCNRVLDMVTGKWLYDLYLTWNPRRSEALQSYVDDPHKTLDAVAARAELPQLHAVEIYVRRPCHAQKLSLLSKNPKVTIVHVP